MRKAAHVLVITLSMGASGTSAQFSGCAVGGCVPGSLLSPPGFVQAPAPYDPLGQMEAARRALDESAARADAVRTEQAARLQEDAAAAARLRAAPSAETDRCGTAPPATLRRDRPLAQELVLPSCSGPFR